MRITVDLSVNDYERELFAERKLVVEMREGETPVHIALKILALALYFDRGLVVEPSFEELYQPDLMLRAEDGRPALWIECGQVRVAKLDKISFRHPETRFVVVKQTAREAENLLARCRGEVRRLRAIEFLGFEPGFCTQLGECFAGRTDVVVISTRGDVQVVANGRTLASKITRLSGAE